MEARSLTALNTLAGNPPQYPINPAQERQDPLTLYISRVPGTRDVILSPFKPQLKNVTAEDVASCLYYVHFKAPSIELGIPPALRDDGHRSSSDESSSMRNIPRKPVPGAPPTPLTPSSPDRLQIPNFGNENQDPTRRRGLSVNSSFDTAHQRAPAWPGNDPNFDEPAPNLPPRPLPVIQAPVSRKPLGPRPLSSPSPGAPDEKALPPPPGQYPGVTNFDQLAAANQQHPALRNDINRSPSPRKSFDSTKQPFTLALIRRDPSTGNQWNVGHISSYQSEAPKSDQDDGNPLFTSVPPVTQPSGTGNPPINVQIETLGYGKFRGMPARRSFDAGPGADMTQPRDGGVVLQRQVAMGYTKSFAFNWREKLNRVEQDGFGRGHGRSGSVGSVDSVGSPASPTEPQISMQPGPGLRPRGYIFTSPWNGRCEFRTGSAGRSLRCYHILHDERQSFNPLTDQGGVSLPQTTGMPVSELRFNLPTAELFKSPEGREEVKTQLQGHFNKLLRREGRSDVVYDDDGMVSPFDINLGKEKAGGGNRGKRAKLGKLIIYPDGLKMLDLVVSANMGLWWQAWERSF
ncbi:oxidoreductase [Fusarium albosuccineum]|uniref:Oxidoreductase n=1 Tax=Fusarium albosuccineum TaxID=1237068 RepID=A0A8H4NP66_9HYPO|nr:oxidoreductase [Fusarium albosuccineum]